MPTSRIKASVVAAVIACAGLLAMPQSADACWLWSYATGGPGGSVVWGQAQAELDSSCYNEGYYNGVNACVGLEGPLDWIADDAWGSEYAEVTVYLPAYPGWHWVEAIGYAPHYWSPYLDLVCPDYASFFIQSPPQVSVTSADIVADNISLLLQPSGLTGTLTVTVGSTQVFSGNRSSGNHNFSFNRESLPAGQYTTVTAQWSTPSGTANGNASVAFQVLGVWRHSQYNTPNENSCTGPPASAYITNPNPSCVFNSTTLKNDFISQAWLNGSGITASYGTVQNEAFCLNQSPPPDAFGRSFRPQSIVPSCGSGYGVGNDTVARGDDSGLNCGDQVLIVGVGIKTVTDRCPACTGHPQLDNYTTASACMPGTIPDLGYFQTIRLQ